jgi:hypothetical protein
LEEHTASIFRVEEQSKQEAGTIAISVLTQEYWPLIENGK